MTVDLAVTRQMFSYHQRYHSGFQIDHFVIGPGLTTYGRFRQSLREMKTRIRNLQETSLRIEELDIEIAQNSQEAFKHEMASNERKLLKIKSTRLRIELDDKRGQLRDASEEFARFYAHAIRNFNALDFSDDDAVEKYERELWFSKLKYRAAVDLLTNRCVSGTVMESILQLPTKDSTRCLEEIKDNGSLMNWVSTVLKNEAVDETEVPEIKMSDLTEMLRNDGITLGCGVLAP